MISRAPHGKPLQLASNACTSFSRHRSTVSAKRTSYPAKRRHGEVERLEAMGGVLTRAVRMSDKNPSFNHYARRKRPQQDYAAPAHLQWKFPSIEKKQFALEPHLQEISLDEGLGSSSTPAGTLEPGCLVELRRHEMIRHGVVLANSSNNRTPSITTLLTTGEIMDIGTSDVMFAIPQFVDIELTSRCGRALECDTSMRAARQRVIRRAREFERAVEELYNGMSWNANALYLKIKQNTMDEWGEISTLEAARLLHAAPNPPIITLFAVHKHLMNQADKYVAQNSSHRQINVFDVRPKSHVNQLKNVRKWVHERHPLLDSFAKKAQGLIDRSRELEKKSANMDQLETEYPDVAFTSAEKEILRFIQLSLDEFRTTQISPYSALVPTIIKKIDRYSGEINNWTVLTLLRELGVHDPWEDMVSKSKDWMKAKGLKSLAPISVGKEDGHSLSEPDAHESVRHDFGQLPVFVIDDLGAEELDDGLSIETDPHDPSVRWLHVHIADPTSAISPSHPAALQARKLSSTTYFVHDTVPMLPLWLGSTGLKDSANLGHKAPQRALTFSVKLSSEGNILDYKIRPSIVRNLHAMRYDDVDAALGFDFVPKNPFEQTPESERPDPSYVQRHVEIIRQIWEVTEQQIALRLKQPIFTYAQCEYQVSMDPKPGPLRPATGDITPILHSGFPKLTYLVYNQTFENGARSMVGECMKLACRVASRFCFDHKIPMFRRASSPLIFKDPNDFERILAARNDRCLVDANFIYGLEFESKAAEYTLDMKEHWAMGIPASEGYMRCTSPLRRFQDMVAHWQIKSALLPKSASSRTPFSEADVVEIAAELMKSQAGEKRLFRRHNKFWAHYFIDRYMKSDTGADVEHPLRRILAQCTHLPMKEQRTMTYHTELFLPPLGLSGVMVSPCKVDHQKGDQILVDVKTVNMGLFPSLILEPTK